MGSRLHGCWLCGDKDGWNRACVPDGAKECENAAARRRNPGLLTGRSAAKFCMMALESMFPFIKQGVNSV